MLCVHALRRQDFGQKRCQNCIYSVPELLHTCLVPYSMSAVAISPLMADAVTVAAEPR